AKGLGGPRAAGGFLDLIRDYLRPETLAEKIQLAIQRPGEEPRRELKGYLRAARDPQVSRYPGALRVEKYRGLNSEQRMVEARMDHYAETNADQILTDYERANTKDGAITIDLDRMREHLPEYSRSKQSRAEHSSSVHNASGALIDRFWERLLKTPGAPDRVIFTGGGGGSGKSASRRIAAASMAGDPYIVYDSTMAGLNSSRARIREALEAGKNVTLL